MAKIKFKVDQKFASQLRETLREELGIRMRNNFGDFRPIVNEAISAAIEQNKYMFIPNDQEAYELGVGEEGAGEINRDKTEGAWKQLLPGRGYVSFSVRKAGTKKNNNVGNIIININFEEFLEAPLSVVEKANEDAPNPIPWLDWFINGAYLGDFMFIGASSANRDIIDQFSRTGGGLMIRPEGGGTWSFEPRYPDADQLINEEILFEVIDAIEANLGDIL